MQQFANGKVDGDLQVVLYQLYLPATAICSRIYLKNKLTCWNILGGVMVMCGCALVAVPGIGPSGSKVWPLVYALAALPLGMACVLQEEVFKDFPNCTVIKMSTWSTIYGTH
jgi:drug/metabolite transporter (DMT)-like permease